MEFGAIFLVQRHVVSAQRDGVSRPNIVHKAGVGRPACRADPFDAGFAAMRIIYDDNPLTFRNAMTANALL